VDLLRSCVPFPTFQVAPGGWSGGNARFFRGGLVVGGRLLGCLSGVFSATRGANNRCECDDPSYFFLFRIFTIYFWGGLNAEKAAVEKLGVTHVSDLWWWSTIVLFGENFIALNETWSADQLQEWCLLVFVYWRGVFPCLVVSPWLCYCIAMI
jgi:hypothetical protein